MKKTRIYILFVLFLTSGFLFYNCPFPEPVSLRSEDEQRLRDAAREREREEERRKAEEAKNNNALCYHDFGAVGDGITDDFEAIIATHLMANKMGLPVKARPGSTFLIEGDTNRTAEIQTDTDWTDAKFIFDDRKVRKIGRWWDDSWIFNVTSPLKPIPIHSITRLSKGQKRLPLNLGERMMIIITDNTTRLYIREGMNQDGGAIQTDVILVEADGTVDPRAPILWDFNNITSMIAYPIPKERLTVKGGHFTTVAYRGVPGDPALRRGIMVTRSNTTIQGLEHDVVNGDVNPVCAYMGFLSVNDAVDVTVQDLLLVGRLHWNMGGTYGFATYTTVNLLMKNIVQKNDIRDPRYWGIMGSSYCKNITLEDVHMSRFDAHTGVHNVTLRNSTFGHQGIAILGTGTLIVDNVQGYANNFIFLRYDYGATWEGNVYIRNSTHYALSMTRTSMLGAPGNPRWNFGFDCYMPKIMFIDGFHVVRSPGVGNYNLVETWGMQGGYAPYPYRISEGIYFKDLRIDSGAELILTNGDEGYLNSELGFAPGANGPVNPANPTRVHFYNDKGWPLLDKPDDWPFSDEYWDEIQRNNPWPRN